MDDQSGRMLRWLDFFFWPAVAACYGIYLWLGL
jgi:hypothetical protein